MAETNPKMLSQKQNFYVSMQSMVLRYILMFSQANSDDCLVTKGLTYQNPSI